jgi:hypothetical protein
MSETTELQQPVEVAVKAKSYSETGHAKNIANFDSLISFATSYGTAYNPAKAAIKLAALQTLSASAKTATTTLNATMPAYSNVIAAREVAFAPMSKLVTRIINALKASDTTANVDENARTLARKLQGVRATPKLSEEAKKALAAEGKEVNEVSASQMGYDNRLENFDKFNKLLASIPLYAPNEADLKVTALTAYYNDLKTKNAAVIAATPPLSNARIARNDIMYKDNTGLYDIAMDVKTYIKSVYGSTSPQYKQVSGLKFTKPR